MFSIALFVLSAFKANAEFQVAINGINTDSVFHSQSNHYGTNTKSATKSDLWLQNTYAGKHPTNYDLMYQRIDSTNAEGGRCQTSSTSTIGGSGTFEAEIYIHSDVRGSTGVFTIAAMPEKFDSTYELDLFVINLADDVMKSGRPQHTQVFKISDYEKKWVKVTMVKSGSYCSTSITNVGSGIVLAVTSGSVSCNLSTGPNHVVVNVRARDGGSDDSDHSFVSIRKITWTSASEAKTNSSAVQV